jgi:hypothetical protein
MTAPCALPSALLLLPSPVARKPPLKLSRASSTMPPHIPMPCSDILPATHMVHYLHSDASYLSEPQARSRVSGHFYLSSKPLDPTKPPPTQPPNNGVIHTVSNILKNVMSSATESEFAGLFHNAKDAEMIRIILSEMGYPQPPTPIQTDISCTTGITNSTIRQRHHPPRQVQGHGHVILLDSRSHTPRPLPRLLEKRLRKSRRLFYKALSHRPSSLHAIHLSP